MSTTPSSCTQKEPFIKLQPDGQASILDYNLPQSTAYKATGYIDLSLANDDFKASKAAKPTKNFWDDLGEIDDAIAKTKIEDDVLQASAIPTFENAPLLRNFDAIKNVTEGETTTQFIGELDKDTIANQIVRKKRPQMYRNIFGKTKVRFIPEPTAAEPKLLIAFHYKMESFLGDYGAGRTLKTFSLLPGEKTTISVRNYTHIEEVKKRAESVLDSFSESSASELQSMVDTEVTSGFSTATQQTNAFDANANASASVNLGIVKIGGGGGGGVSGSTTVNSSMEQQVSVLTSSTDTQVSKADSLREIEVNTETTSTQISETETNTVRELQNINLSRVLNFVFRQLLQEFVTITYLDDVSLVYTNGYPESTQRAKISDIDNFLSDILESEQVVVVKNQIFQNLCSIYDYEGTKTAFIEQVTEELTNCIDGGETTQTYVRKKKNLTQTFDGHTVSGIIIDTKKRIVRTSALVVDALLGQGEALDCYNQKLQDAATLNATLENDKIAQMMEVINMIDDPLQKADLYKKVFGDCCDVPQSGCGCNETPTS